MYIGDVVVFKWKYLSDNSWAMRLFTLKETIVTALKDVIIF